MNDKAKQYLTLKKHKYTEQCVNFQRFMINK